MISKVWLRVSLYVSYIYTTLFILLMLFSYLVFDLGKIVGMGFWGMLVAGAWVVIMYQLVHRKRTWSDITHDTVWLVAFSIAIGSCLSGQ